MTEKEMDRLAEKIVDMLLNKQEKYDAQFMEEFNDAVKKSGYEINIKNEEDTIENRISMLEKQLAESLEVEDYLSASKIQELLNKLKQ